MLEIEMKFAALGFEAIQRCLQVWQAASNAPNEEMDQYFNAPDRDFALTDEALRIRTRGNDNFLTYKGPKIDAHTKTRTEIEVKLSPGKEEAEKFGRLLVSLGYRPVAAVHKRRIVHHLNRGGFDLEVCLDDVAEVGTFVELEIVAPAEQLEKARAVLFAVSDELGLSRSERRSYLEMLLTKRGLA